MQTGGRSRMPRATRLRLVSNGRGGRTQFGMGARGRGSPWAVVPMECGWVLPPCSRVLHLLVICPPARSVLRPLLEWARLTPCSFLPFQSQSLNWLKSGSAQL